MSHTLAPPKRRKSGGGDGAAAPKGTDRSHHRAPAGGGTLVALPIQRKLSVSKAGDPMEQEADTVAERVTAGRPAGPISTFPGRAGAQRQEEQAEEVQRQPEEEEPIQAQAEEQEEEEVQRQPEEEEPIQAQAEEEEVQRQPEEEEPIQAQAEEQEEEEVQRQPEEEEPIQAQAEDEEAQTLRPAGTAPRVTPKTASAIRSPGLGSPVPASVRGAIEPHLGASLGGVRVHGDSRAAQAAGSLGAKAFTVGSDIFLSRAASPHDTRLMAHEAAHVVQQGAAGNRHHHAARAAEEVQLLPDFITDRLASYARHIPGYTLFTVIIGFNPLTGRDVERNAMNLVEGLMGLVPFGTFIFDKLRELGVLQDAFEWVQRQLATYNLTLARLEQTIEDAWDDMDFIRWDPVDYNIGVLRRHFGALIDDVESFAGSVVDKLIELIKEALIGVAEGLLEGNAAWDLVKKVIHHDPLRDEPVEATTVEILEDFLRLIGKETELEQMREKGTLQETADWIDTQIGAFLSLLSELGGLFSAAWEAIQPQNLPDIMTNLQALAVRAGGFLQRLWDFASTVALKVLELIKNALLAALAGFVDDVPGFHLITVILGRNPFTGEAVPRTAVNIIRGFISLLPGGNQIFQQLEETGVVTQAGARIEGALADLGITWEFIVGIFTGIWDSLSIDDLIDPIGAFTRIRDQFGEPISRLFQFIRVVVEEVFKLILALMNFPTDILGRIITNAMQAFEDIKRDPIGFLKNMLAAVKLGFSNFFDNFLTHLVNGLVDWLFGGLREAGIEPPEDLSLGSILDVVLQVLGLTMDRIWEKLAERFGQERIDQIRGAIDRLVGIWNFIRDVQERGIPAIWEYIEDQISNLWNMVLEAATNWIMEKIISRVTAKLLSMLDPTGIMAVVNSFIAFFNAVQSAIEYIREILEIVDSYVATLAAVAAGDIEPGAARMEGGLAAVIPVAIGFLANQVGLGNIGEKMQEIIEGVRETVDNALDWLLDRLEEGIQAVLNLLGMGGAEEGEEGAEPEVGDVRDTVRNRLSTLLRAEHTLDELRAILAEQLAAHREHGLTALYLGPEREDGSYPIVAEASPPLDLLTVIPGVREGSRAAVRAFIRLTLAGPDPAFQMETVQLEVAPSDAQVQEYVEQHFGRAVVPAGATDAQREAAARQFRTWQLQAIAALTTTESVDVPAGASVDAAIGVLRTSVRRRDTGNIPRRNYRLVRRFEAPHGRATHGGAVFETTNNIVDAEFWSTGTMGEGRRGDNSTHAEFQFMAWYRSLDESVRSRVTHIHLQNHSYSPCWTCSRQLVAFMRSARRASGHEVAGDIVWSVPYLEENYPTRAGGVTLPSSLSDLAGAGWRVTPSSLPDQGPVDERFATAGTSRGGGRR